MTSTPAVESVLRTNIREKASDGGELSEFVTKVCTEEAHTPPARVTKVAKSAAPPAAKPAPIQVESAVLPGLVRKCKIKTKTNQGSNEPVSTGSQAQ